MECGFLTPFVLMCKGRHYPLMFLATAAHVAEEFDGFDFYIRANKKEGSLAEIKQDGSTRRWYRPTERDAVDAALMVFPVNEVGPSSIAGGRRAAPLWLRCRRAVNK
jgi:hypothetical protein